MYEYLLTLDQEVNLFWRRKLTGASVLYFLNRYLLLLLYAMETSSPVFSRTASEKVRDLKEVSTPTLTYACRGKGIRAYLHSIRT